MVRFKKLIAHTLNDGPFYVELLRIMSTDMHNLEPELRDLLSKGDAKGVKSYHHKLATTLKLLELDELHQALTALRKDLASGTRWDPSCPNYNQAISESRKISKEIHSEIQRLAERGA